MAEAEPGILGSATRLIRAGRQAEAVAQLMDALPMLPERWHRPVYRLAGLAWYFAGRHPEALDMFRTAAEGSEVPEDQFNVAMSQVKVGDIEGAHGSWQRCFDLSYAHQQAPETSSFFEKKLLFAEALLAAGAADERGLDLVERQLMGFFTHHHVTDPSFWAIRRVPALQEVLPLTLAYYRALGRTEGEWQALCDRVSAGADSEGQAYIAALRARFAEETGPPSPAPPPPPG